MEKPQISIIVPVYNVEPYISECIQSVMNQTYQGPMECIVVDDCGTDMSVAIAEEVIAHYKGTIEFKVLHHEQNQGISVARNTGVEAARGDYVFFLDSDDTISDDCIDYLVALAAEGEFDIAVGNHDLFGNKSSQGRGMMIVEKEKMVVSGEQYLKKLLFGYEVVEAVWNKLYSLSYLRENNMYFAPGIVLEDTLFIFRLSCQHTKMIIGNKVSYHYRIRPNSIVKSFTPTTLRESFYRVWLLIRPYCSVSYNEIHEDFLHYYGTKVFTFSRKNALPFKECFFRMNREYPYKPLMIWLSGKQNFHWYKTRLIWSLPPLLGYSWFQLKWIVNNSNLNNAA